MSSIAMAADSTQGEHIKNAKNKQKRRKNRSYSTSSDDSSEDSIDIKPNKKHKKMSAKGSKADSSDSNHESDLDLSKELLPISGYIDDKEVMIENMFKSITSKKLKTMLPEILQKLSSKELKVLCLGQLNTMSSAGIRKILEGVPPGAIDWTASEEDNKGLPSRPELNQEDCNQSKIRGNSKADSEETKLQLVVQDKSQASRRSKETEATLERGAKKVEHAKCSSQKVDKERSIDIEKNTGRRIEKKDAHKDVLCDKDNKTVEDSKEINNEKNLKRMDEKKKEVSKNHLEILELEMRARAIKAMLKAQEEIEKKTTGNVETKSRADGSDDKTPAKFKQTDSGGSSRGATKSSVTSDRASKNTRSR